MKVDASGTVLAEARQLPVSLDALNAFLLGLAGPVTGHFAGPLGRKRADWQAG